MDNGRAGVRISRASRRAPLLRMPTTFRLQRPFHIRNSIETLAGTEPGRPWTGHCGVFTEAPLWLVGDRVGNRLAPAPPRCSHCDPHCSDAYSRSSSRKPTMVSVVHAPRLHCGYDKLIAHLIEVSDHRGVCAAAPLRHRQRPVKPDQLSGQPLYSRRGSTASATPSCPGRERDESPGCSLRSSIAA